MSTIVTVSGKGSPLTHTEFDANFTNLNTDKLDDAVSNGSQYIRQNGAWSNFTVDALVETSSTKPSSPIDGHAWFSESNGVTYVYDSASGDWIALGSSNTSGISSLAAASDTGISSIANGDVLNYSSTDSAFKNAQQHIPSSSYVTPATVYKLTQYNGTNTNWVTLTSWSPSVSGGYFTLDSGYWIVEASMTLDQTNNDINGIFARLVGPSGTARAPASLGDTQISRGPESTILITLLTSVSSTASYHFQVYFGLVTGGGGTRNTGTFDASISFIKVGDV
jgi:hypothetical protein